jgi:hypothetical protein
MECLTNPVQNIRMPKQPAGRERRLTDGEEQALLDAADYPLKEMIILALETGTLLGEILSIKKFICNYSIRGTNNFLQNIKLVDCGDVA